MTGYRFATFNASLSRRAAGRLIQDLTTPDHPQARAVAEIIQRVRPDVLLLNEFDYDPAGRALKLFRRHYLQVGRNGAEPVDYPYVRAFASNTGIPSGFDLDKDGEVGGPGDALGFGFFEGQYAFVLLSRYPLVETAVRTFQTFLWRDMPAARLPRGSDGPWFSDEALAVVRLSSKNHVDVPVTLPGGTVHVLAAHPTPPVFDGPEHRNGLRNFAEIRLLADYITPGRGDYLYDDQGGRGGLAEDQPFVIMGDMNADPVDGNSTAMAIWQLLGNHRVDTAAATGEAVPYSLGGVENLVINPGAHEGAVGDPGRHTASWGLRADYVLPSARLKVLDSGVFWPASPDPLHRLVENNASSDHRLVWVDVALPGSDRLS